MMVAGAARFLVLLQLFPLGLALHQNKRLELRSVEAPQTVWPLARGRAPGQFGTSSVVPPRNLSAALKWSWHHPGGRYHTTLGGGPVIDNDKNLYLTANDGIRKFSPEGQVLWHYPPPGGDMNNEPSLMGNRLYGNTKDGHAFALDIATGKEVWKTRPSTSAGGDVGYPGAYDGVFVMGTEVGMHPRSPGGCQRVVGLDGSSGSELWSFRTEYPVWNVMPLFPGDGTVVFMDFTGGVYRLGLHNGTLIWHSPSRSSSESFTDGGVILGPNSVAYSCSNFGSGHGGEGSEGLLRAVRVEDGAQLWERQLPQPCNSWPTVGRLASQEELSVVVTPGAFMMNRKSMHGSIMAFDAASGAPRWQYQAPVYRNPPLGMAKGDGEGFAERLLFDRKHPICLPAHWSSPSITGEGEVFAGRSDGKIYRVKGPAGSPLGSAQSFAALTMDFATTAGVQVDVFDAGGASLHGALAFAPGLMAFASCDSMFVFSCP